MFINFEILHFKKNILRAHPQSVCVNSASSLNIYVYVKEVKPLNKSEISLSPSFYIYLYTYIHIHKGVYTYIIHNVYIHSHTPVTAIGRTGQAGPVPTAPI